VSLGFEAGPPNDLLFGEPSKEQIPLGAFPQLVREQSEHGEAVLSGYVDLAVCLSRHCKLHGGACSARSARWTAEERRCDIRSVVSIQNRGAVRWPCAEIKDPDYTVRGAARRDNRCCTAKREHITRF